jgi:hypothetical protein
MLGINIVVDPDSHTRTVTFCPIWGGTQGFGSGSGSKGPSTWTGFKLTHKILKNIPVVILKFGI